ncbi:MAG: AMP-binding protein, partial [Crocinitomicaceae bacterium]
STGKPKGTLVNHGSLFQFLHSCKRKYPTDEKVIQPFVASISFDISLFQMFYPLVMGGEIIVVEKETFQNPEAFVQVLKRSTMFDTVPAMFGSIVEYLLSSGQSSTLPSIKRLFIGGDRIPNQLIKKLQRVFNKAEIAVTYGPTEATICSTGYFYDVLSEKDEPNGAIIGAPDDNSSIYIVNEDVELQPKGVIGEICIGGVGVAQGYLNRADLTAEKFIQNPFVDGEPLYRTGDLGRWTDDNLIEFIGRLDDQVKVRGYRIELGEIEYIISQIEQVEQVVVVAIDHPHRSEKELVAYLTTHKGEETKIDSTVLRARLKEKLPDYMIPAYFMELSSIPLTANGKVDRKNLPTIDDLNLGNSAEYVAANTEIEKQLVKIWEEVLERQTIGINDDFFELGGHSLKALRLIMSIKQELDVKLEIKQLFQNTTILLLAKEIDRINWLSKGTEEDESNLDIIEI